MAPSEFGVCIAESASERGSAAPSALWCKRCALDLPCYENVHSGQLPASLTAFSRHRRALALRAAQEATPWRLAKLESAF